MTPAEMFRDWFNNYLTLAHFAECHGISVAQAAEILAQGKREHEAAVAAGEVAS